MTDDTTPITLLDGGMGQELVARSPDEPTGLWSSKIMMDHPHLVSEIHREYFLAGADVATTNTYAVHRDRLAAHGLDHLFEDLHRQGCRLAGEARDAAGRGLVAGSLGPLGWSYSHDGAPPADRAAELYNEICAIQRDHVDVFLIETIASVEQATGALQGAIGNGKPVWLALSVDDADGANLRSGEPLTDLAPVLAKTRPDAILLNCSTPEAIEDGIAVLSGFQLPFGAYANGFTRIETYFLKADSAVDGLKARQDLTPAAYADFVDGWLDHGASIVGGCCEVGPAHIAEISNRLGRRAA
ncbi:MAG: homocysteine S-methyltransferase family protein [Paracoccaceae bacterium]|nr:homocysteine S-methyltransferase family protein [Paracoccaceae bacterium]